MTLADKRKVIEVLLCASGSPVVSTLDAAEAVGLTVPYWADAMGPTYRDTPGMRYSDRQIEAAYRLIESSPTLRREWFSER